MAKKAKEEEVTSSSVGDTSEDQISNFLKKNKNHLNFEKPHNYKVSSGSLLLDMKLQGGIGPGVHRFTGYSEGGKSSCALSFALNFQKTVPNSKVIYIKSEGRFSQEMKDRSGLDFAEDKFAEIKTNVYDDTINLIRELVKNNNHDKRYFFIIDSVDALVPLGDMDKGFSESHKVAGGAVLGTNFLRSMALKMNECGHVCILISQVRANVNLDPYAKDAPKMTNSSGGNALYHYSNWILDFESRFGKDIIRKDPDDRKSEILGHFCKISFKKTPNETTDSHIAYPIRYGRKNGTSIWREYEVVDMMIAYELLKKNGAWLKVDERLIAELKEKNLEMGVQYNGIEKFRQFMFENPKITDYLVEKFKSIVSQ